MSISPTAYRQTCLIGGLRAYHKHLNRLIIARLPQALPPEVCTPSLYVIGLQRFAIIYLCFESLWTEIIDIQPLEASQAIDHRVFSALKHLYLPDLLRTETIRSDISYLLQKSSDAVHEELASLQGTHLQGFIDHFEQTCAVKPHVLIAYAWVMYMALFNGGRWIRSQVVAARDSAWSHQQSLGMGSNSYIEKNAGTSFWHFAGEEDGDDIKEEFQNRLVDIEGLLSIKQRQDIIDEAQQIFLHLTLLVEELDAIAAAHPKEEDTPSKDLPWSILFVKHILPLGFAGFFYALLEWISSSKWYAQIIGRQDSHHGEHHKEKSE